MMNYDSCNTGCYYRGKEQPSPACPEQSVGINSVTKQSLVESEIASLGSEVGIKREEFREPHRSQ